MAAGKARPGRATDTGQIKTLLQQIDSKLDDARNHEKNWRSLEIKADTLFGMGLLVIGVSVPIITSGLTELTLLSLGTSIVPGALLVWIGVILLRLPVGLKEHFLGHEDQLEPFLRSIDDQTGSTEALIRWTRQPEVRGKYFSRQVRQAIVAFKIGWLSVAILAGTFVLLQMAMVFFVTRYSIGIIWAIGLVAVLVIVYGGLVWGLARRAKRNEMIT